MNAATAITNTEVERIAGAEWENLDSRRLAWLVDEQRELMGMLRWLKAEERKGRNHDRDGGIARDAATRLKAVKAEIKRRKPTREQMEDARYDADEGATG